jgi:hypothetical protein
MLGVAFLALGAGRLEAQERVRLSGWVQWMGGSRMQVMTDGGTVAVDLRDADQGSYQALRTGERVTIDGVVTADRRMVMAQRIWRESGFDVQSP